MAVWAEPVARLDRGHVAHEMRCGCPYCHSEDVEELYPCHACSALHPYEDLDEGLCPICKSSIQHKVEAFLAGLSWPMQTWFNGHYDGGL
jgi:uncharacterized paraquat-inducible protein A